MYLISITTKYLHDAIILLYSITSSCRGTDSIQCYFHNLRCQTESKISSKENMHQVFCHQELQNGTGKDKAFSAWKLLYIKVGLSPFLLMNFYLILHAPTAVVQQPTCHFRNIEPN